MVLVTLLSYRRVYRTLPVFYLYVAFGLASDSVMMFLQSRFAPAQYLRLFLDEMSFDTLFQFAVLVELAWSVLRPYCSGLPRKIFTVIPVTMVLLGALAWPLANLRGFENFPPQWHFLAHLQASIAVLRVMFFLVLAAGSHLLAMGWRDRELQVATGLGFYSMISLGAAILHSYQKLGEAYHAVDIAVAASYFVSMLYWIASFAQKEVPRREASPEMRSLLPVLARAAHLQLELERARSHEDGLS